jgi:hypothetical protein
MHRAKSQVQLYGRCMSTAPLASGALCACAWFLQVHLPQTRQREENMVLRVRKRRCSAQRRRGAGCFVPTGPTMPMVRRRRSSQRRLGAGCFVPTGPRTRAQTARRRRGCAQRRLGAVCFVPTGPTLRTQSERKRRRCAQGRHEVGCLVPTGPRMRTQTGACDYL